MPHEPFAGVATTLVQAGLPAAVAMRSSISDPGAIAFSKCFYGGLAKGEPVDVAVTHGRRMIAPDCTDSLEWSVPMLFLRPGDARLFAERPESPVPGHVINIGSIQNTGDLVFGINQK